MKFEEAFKRYREGKATEAESLYVEAKILQCENIGELFSESPTHSQNTASRTDNALNDKST